MRKMKQLFTTIIIALFTMTMYSQGVVTGQIIDGETDSALLGVNIVEKGTTNGVITNEDGSFSLNVSENAGTLTLSYVGYITKNLQFNTNSPSLGVISLNLDLDALDEVVVIGSGVIDLASGRQTPVAVSSIRGADIQLKASGNVEFTEALKNTPSVYVSNQSGGFGDSQIFLRGFDQTNTAFLLNGQPINGMEDGRMYWSNWSGMSDVANAVEIQRGLGSSKLAISSVGGTVNIISKTTDSKEGGFVRFLAGNDSYFKSTASYNTGLSESGLAFSFMIDHWQAHRKYSEGTNGQGQNYLFSVGYKPNDRHALNFLITGAPQWHNQNFSNRLEVYEERGEKFNGNYGYLDGSIKSERTNFYHKPVANLNWDFDINDNLDLSTVIYASWGRGGGTGPFGRGSMIRTEDGLIDWNQIIDNNQSAANENGIGIGYPTQQQIDEGISPVRILRASMNNHNWYGALSSLNYELNNWNFNVGVDGRTYTGDHFRQINDLLGLNGFEYNGNVLTETYESNPWSTLFNSAEGNDRIDYDYSETINYVGGFGQAEYATELFSVFAQGAYSYQDYQRVGRFPSHTDGLGESEKVSKVGYNVKGGASLNLNSENTIFANTGYYSRQPYLDNIFVNVRNSNDLVEPNIANEEIKGYEVGYRFKNDNFRLNVDGYWTEWGNRFLSRGFQGDGAFFIDRFTDLTQVHKGVEYEFEYRSDLGNFRLRTFGSIGNWKYEGSTPFTRQNDETGEFVESGTVELSGTKVGNAPQTSFGFGTFVRVTETLSLDADYNIYSNLYGQVNPLDVVNASEIGETYQAESLPSYTLLDAGITYRKGKVTLRGNVYNVFNTSYINQADSFGVFLGVGRTYNVSLRYNI